MADFFVQNDMEANEAIKKIKCLEAEKDKWSEFYKIQDKKVSEKIQGKIDYYKAALVKYFESEDAVKRETKTMYKISLPDGDLVFTKPKQKFAYDDKKLIEYLKLNHMTEYIKSKESVSWEELKKILTVDNSGNVINSETGELIDIIGSELVPGTFNVK